MQDEPLRPTVDEKPLTPEEEEVVTMLRAMPRKRRKATIALIRAIVHSGFTIMTLALALPAVAADFSGTVTRIRDGDTIVVGKQPVRLCGVTSPERGKPGGKPATEAMKALALGKHATCTPVGSGTACDGRSPRQSYDRVVATCRVDGQDLAAEMVRAGHAEDWPKFSGGAYAR